MKQDFKMKWKMGFFVFLEHFFQYSFVTKLHWIWQFYKAIFIPEKIHSLLEFDFINIAVANYIPTTDSFEKNKRDIQQNYQAKYLTPIKTSTGVRYSWIQSLHRNEKQMRYLKCVMSISRVSVENIYKKESYHLARKSNINGLERNLLYKVVIPDCLLWYFMHFSCEVSGAPQRQVAYGRRGGWPAAVRPYLCYCAS